MTEPTPDAPVTDATPDTPDAPKPTETVDFWKAKARDWEGKAKANKTAAERLAEIEEANKTEAQKTAERLTAAEAKAAEAERRAVRFEIASEFSLSGDQAKALEHVTSEDGMREVASLLAAKAAQDKKSGNHVPREGSNSSTVNNDLSEFREALFNG